MNFFTVRTERHNGSGQRLPKPLYSTQLVSLNPLHPDCYPQMVGGWLNTFEDKLPEFGI